MTVPDDKTALGIASAALGFVKQAPSHASLLDLGAQLDHINATQKQWRLVVAYLAAQVHAERNISGVEKGRAAIDTLHGFELAIARFREHHP